MKLVRLIVIDFIMLHILSLITAPILFTVILGAATIFTMQQVKEIKKDKAKKEAEKQNNN